MSEPYNDIKQVEMTVKTAQKMVGYATMSMDPDQLKDATNALNQAKTQYQEALANQTGVDQQLFQQSAEILRECETQLSGAKNE
ncbi:DUF2564 family protein [Bacillus taeanensis]|uniref:DUF2564 domain-containing protein n=1 Tax=Bacillus taeanensis TaxID=273032 RepID=A0A366XUC6_9BACI|nr:DUF2564 family protein [Bacillus taeanensis]RBW69168.1 DUF2564 domain-containing protein [Bacillus taeanensis]